MTALKMHWQLIQGAISTYSGNRRSQTSCAALHARKFTEVQDENNETYRSCPMFCKTGTPASRLVDSALRRGTCKEQQHGIVPA